MTPLDEFRKEKDKFFANDNNSPLSPEQREHFKGLSYFPENPDLRLEISVTPFAEQEMVQLPTSTGDIKSYTRFGRFSFNVDGQNVELTLFGSPHGYFLPFVDSLPARKPTAPAGILILNSCQTVNS